MSAVADQPRSFGVSVIFVGERVVVAVRGEVDLVTGPKLGGIIDAVVGMGYSDVVLDLSDLNFMDAAGLKVIAGVTGRLLPSDERLAIHHAPSLVRRILDICGMTESVVLEDPPRPSYPGPDKGHLGAEQTGAIPGTPVLEPEVVARGLRRMGSLPADNDVVDGALRLVVALAQATVEGADGVSVSLTRYGRLATVAASDQTIVDMDADQYATGEGPCVDAALCGRWFHAESLDTETRWPAFTPRARGLGINAILSSPLLAAERPVGALNIYSRTAAAFSTEQQHLASIFASEVSTILANAGTDVDDEAVAHRLGEALQLRQIVALAQGALMERHKISAEDAYRRLLRLSRTTNVGLGERAAEIVSLIGQRAAPSSGFEMGTGHG